MSKTGLFFGVAALALLSAQGARAGTLWIANLNQAGENPPTGAPFTGTGFLVLNDAETSASVTATHNINITLTGGHIHRGGPTVNGPIIFPFPNPASPVGPLIWAIPAADVVNLKTSGLYMNFHTSVNPGGAIRATLVRSLLAPAAKSASQLAVANALDVSAGLSSDLDGILMGQAVAPAAAQAQALDDLSGRTVYAQGRQSLETMVDFEGGLFGHAEALTQAPDQRFGLFATGGDAFGKRDTYADQAGSKISRPFVLAGFDYGLAPGVSAGLGVGYADGKDKFRAGLGETKAKTTSVQGFVSSRGEGFVVTAIAGYGWTKFDTRRNLASLGRTAASSHDGRVWTLGAKVSAPLAFGRTTLSPYGLVDWQQAKIDAYAESGAGSAGLVVPKRKDKNAALEAGAAWAVPLGGEAGGLTARFQAGWRYLLDDGRDAFTATVIGSPVGFRTEVLSQGQNGAHLSAELAGALAPNLTASVGYHGIISRRYDTHAVAVRLSLRL
jgi:uncharacterized protein YhjY with autotransporter beta-barrel domain